MSLKGARSEAGYARGEAGHSNKQSGKTFALREHRRAERRDRARKIAEQDSEHALRCPKCGSGECHPTKNAVLIRGFKVFDEDGAWSQCLVCSGGYNNWPEFSEATHDASKGWFVS